MQIKIKKIISGLVVFLVFLMVLPMERVGAQQGTTILPEPIESIDCNEDLKKNPTKYLQPPAESANINPILTCAVKTGDIHMWMVPYFIKYVAEFLIGLAGIACMLFIVIGGYQYTFAGISEGKERGKLTLVYSIIGLALVLLSWTIVNVVLFFVTA